MNGWWLIGGIVGWLCAVTLGLMVVGALDLVIGGMIR